jgi:hypothetical protein
VLHRAARRAEDDVCITIAINVAGNKHTRARRIHRRGRFAAHIGPSVTRISQHSQAVLNDGDKIEQSIVVVVDELRRRSATRDARYMKVLFPIAERKVANRVGTG